MVAMGGRKRGVGMGGSVLLGGVDDMAKMATEGEAWGMSRWIVKGLVLAVMAVWGAVATVPDADLHVVFCDVGQGDAILIWKGSGQVLIDSGPGDRVLRCLGRYMPFYDRQIEAVLLTHPDADHSGGMPEVFERYRVEWLATVPVGAETTAYQRLLEEIREQKINYQNLYVGDRVKLGKMEMEVMWPTREFVAENLEGEWRGATGGGGETRILGAQSMKAKTNEFSLGVVVSYGSFDLLTSGDGDGEIMSRQVEAGGVKPVEVIKVPHHGSRLAAVGEWFDKARPGLAVISVGRNNYGHPSEEVMELLKSRDVEVARTDVGGDVEVVSDGKKWWVK